LSLENSHFFTFFLSFQRRRAQAIKPKNMASTTSAPEGEKQPQEQQQRAPGLPRAEFIEDIGKFLEGETRG
jgi:hypothetical protein